MNWIKSTVVKLATNQKSNLGQLKHGQKGLIYYPQPIGENNGDGNGTYPIHLYFTSDEPIKEGDWFLLNNNHPQGQIRKCWEIRHGDFYIDDPKDPKRGWGFVKPTECKKIIATTDKSLGLPEPSKEFLEVYAKTYAENKPIIDILVEYEYIVTNEDFSKNPVQVDGYLQIKVKSDNTITIKKVKDSWSREEIEDLFWKAHQEDIIEINGYQKEAFNKWIEQNL